MVAELLAEQRTALQVAEIVRRTESEGPGRRFTIWLQGCPLRCAGCCNPEMLPATGGRTLTVRQLLDDIQCSAHQEGVEGITLIGGEPFAQPEGASVLAEGIQRLGLSVVVFSGYTIEELHRMAEPAVGRLLDHCDVLVDGRYIRELPEMRRRWIGSANQRVHFLTDRYRADDPCWRLPNSLEIRLVGSEVHINGHPASQAEALWKRVGVRSGWMRAEES